MKLSEVLENPDQDDTFAVTIALQEAGLAKGFLTPKGIQLASYIGVASYGLEHGDNLADLIAALVRTVWGKEAFNALAALPNSPKYD